MTFATNLLLTGGHAHDFAATSQAVAEVLAGEGITTRITQNLDEAFAELAAGAHFDLLTVNAVRFRMLPERYSDLRGAYAFEMDDTGRDAIVGHLRRGGGLLALHTAPICFDDWPLWGEIVGASWDWDASGHPPPQHSQITFSAEEHPISSGLPDFELIDEVYHGMALEPDVVALATSPFEGAPQPLLWARTWEGSRVAADLLGHSRSSVEHPLHSTLLARSALWALGRPDDEVAAAGGRRH